MSILNDLQALTPNQRNVVVATFLGWTLDAFDFFIIVFVFKDIAKEFNTDIPSVTATLFLTLAMRPLGAFIFGILADRFGRRPTLMANILFYSIVEFLSGFAPTLTVLIILRALYGIAMGGEWGIGASLTMESIPPKTRGSVSGILQAGYPTGYCWQRSCTGVHFTFSVGAECSWSARCRRSSCCLSARTSKNRPHGKNAALSQLSPEEPLKEIGASFFT